MNLEFWINWFFGWRLDFKSSRPKSKYRRYKEYLDAKAQLKYEPGDKDLGINDVIEWWKFKLEKYTKTAYGIEQEKEWKKQWDDFLTDEERGD